MNDRHLQARILVVDDMPDAVQLLEAILTVAGYANLRCTTDSHQVSAIFTEFEPDIVLLDLMMPGLDGFAVMEQLRSLIADDSYMPILILTADIAPESKRRALEWGAVDFLTKPYDHTEVLLRIRNMIEIRLLYLDLQQQNEELETRNQQLQGTIHELALSRHETQAALESLRASQKQLQALSHRLIEAQEAERRFISQELHDEIGQALTAVKINLQTLRDTCDMAALPPLDDSIRITDRALHQVRGLSLDLRPAMLDDFGLVDTLLWYVERQARTANLALRMNLDPLPQRLPTSLETTCYRVVQEAITNIMRHAHARSIDLDLRLTEEGLQLEVRDDGQGFDVAAARQLASRCGSLGLISMRERVELLGGNLSIESSSNQGTCVSAHFPRTAFAPDAE